MRGAVKHALGRGASRRPANGLTALIYHRVGGSTADELDLPVEAFRAQLDVLAGHRVLPLDTALDELDAGDDRPKVVVTFDDGFAELHGVVLPLLVERGLPFVLYLATGYVGGLLHWEGSTARAPALGLDWGQLGELQASGLCTFGNHTHTHARPDLLSTRELERCNDEIRSRLGIVPRHFAYPWGVRVPSIEPALRARFRSAATGTLGRAHPGDDFLSLPRIPVRGSDPVGFFAAKLAGRLLPERAYARIVSTAKWAGIRG